MEGDNINRPQSMKIRMLQSKEYPPAPETMKYLYKILREEGITDPIEAVDIHNKEDAKRERFLGSPTIQINGLDIEVARRGDPPHYGGRMYETEDRGGYLPSPEMIVKAVNRARAQKIKVLFLCTGNSCRSQMAEGWARFLQGDILDAYSAGIETHGLNPYAVKVMAEVGVDISEQRSKLVSELMETPFEYVITVCGHAYETCPVFPGKAVVIHQGFDDPPRLAEGAKTEEEAIAPYRKVRDEIRSFIWELADKIAQERDL
jgi:arsenate reductase